MLRSFQSQFRLAPSLSRLYSSSPGSSSLSNALPNYATPPAANAGVSPAHEFSVRQLMNARVHMGHKASLWNPRMAPYILGERNGLHIIDLDQSVPLLRRALIVVSQLASSGGTFLWLGPRDVQKSRIVRRQAARAGAYTIDGHRWIGGTLTNPIESRQAEKFQYRLPDCVFVIDTNRHQPALREARQCGIPTVGIVDSDCDPSLVSYPIPGNDDGAHAIYLYCHLMRRAILTGRNKLKGVSAPRKRDELQ